MDPTKDPEPNGDREAEGEHGHHNHHHGHPRAHKAHPPREKGKHRDRDVYSGRYNKAEPARKPKSMESSLRKPKPRRHPSDRASSLPQLPTIPDSKRGVQSARVGHSYSHGPRQEPSYNSNISPRSFPGGHVGEQYRCNPRLRKRLVSPDNWKRDQGHTQWFKSIVRRHEDLRAREMKQDHLGEQRVSKMIDNIQQAELKRQQREKENLLLREKRMAETAARLEDLKKQMNKRLSDKQKALKMRLRGSIQAVTAVTGGLGMPRSLSIRRSASFMKRFREDQAAGKAGAAQDLSAAAMAAMLKETPDGVSMRSVRSASTPDGPSEDDAAEEHHRHKPDTPDETDPYGSLLSSAPKVVEVKQPRRRVSMLSGPGPHSNLKGDRRASGHSQKNLEGATTGHQQVVQNVETLDCWDDALPWLEPPEMPARSEMLKEEVEAVWEKPGVFKNRLIKLDHQ